MKILKFQNKISYHFIVLLLFFFYSASSFAGFTYNNTWVIPDNQECDSLGTVSFKNQAVGILEEGESRKIKIAVPNNATFAYFSAKSHAPKPSMDLSKIEYTSICYNDDFSTCAANEIPVAIGGEDTLAAVNKSYIQKHSAIDANDKNLFVYQANIGENFGTSSMYAAVIAFKLTPVECANRAAGVIVVADDSTTDAGSVTNDDGSITIDTISYSTDPGVALVSENLRDKNSTLNELYTSTNNSQFKILQRTNNSNELILLDDGSMSFLGSKSEAFDYVLIDSNNVTIATGTVEITVKGDEIFDAVSNDARVATIDEESEIKLEHDPLFFINGMVHINRLMIEVDGEVLEVWVDLKHIPGTTELEVVASDLIDKSKLNENGLVDQDDDGVSIDEGDCNDNDETVYPDSPGDENPDKTFNCSLE